MKSKPVSNASASFEWHVPTTPEDIHALRRIREQIRPWPMDQLNRLAPPDWCPVSPRRRVLPNAEPFRL